MNGPHWPGSRMKCWWPLTTSGSWIASIFGGRAVMTAEDHPSGTDRLAEVALNFEDVDVIV